MTFYWSLSSIVTVAAVACVMILGVSCMLHAKSSRLLKWYDPQILSLLMMSVACMWLTVCLATAPPPDDVHALSLRLFSAPVALIPIATVITLTFGDLDWIRGTPIVITVSWAASVFLLCVLSVISATVAFGYGEYVLLPVL